MKTLGDVGDKSGSIIECHVLMRLKWLGTRVRAYSRPPGLQCSHRKNKQVEFDTWELVFMFEAITKNRQTAFSASLRFNLRLTLIRIMWLLIICLIIASSTDHGARRRSDSKLESCIIKISSLRKQIHEDPGKADKDFCFYLIKLQWPPKGEFIIIGN